MSNSPLPCLSSQVAKSTSRGLTVTPILSSWEAITWPAVTVSGYSLVTSMSIVRSRTPAAASSSAARRGLCE